MSHFFGDTTSRIDHIVFGGNLLKRFFSLLGEARSFDVIFFHFASHDRDQSRRLQAFDFILFRENAFPAIDIYQNILCRTESLQYEDSFAFGFLNCMRHKSAFGTRTSVCVANEKKMSHDLQETFRRESGRYRLPA